MGKLAQLASVKSTKHESFVYTPPERAFGAGRILVKPSLGYAIKHPTTVSLPVLASVLRGLRRAAPLARILIVESVVAPKTAPEVFEFHKISGILDDEMRVAGMENLLLQEYPNTSPAPVQFERMTAPEYLAEFDCIISVSAFKKTIVNHAPQISASLKNLYGFFPPNLYPAQKLHAPEVLADIYFTIGQYIHGAVVDLTAKYVSPDERLDRSRGVSIPVGQVVWGDDLLAVDEAACRLAHEPIPDYIPALRQLQQKAQKA